MIPLNLIIINVFCLVLILIGIFIFALISEDLMVTIGAIIIFFILFPFIFDNIIQLYNFIKIKGEVLYFFKPIIYISLIIIIFIGLFLFIQIIYLNLLS